MYHEKATNSTISVVISDIPQRRMSEECFHLGLFTQLSHLHTLYIHALLHVLNWK
jgi:hypothetical protein